MSLDVAMNTALSGLKVSQESLAVLSNNIANANTEGYARRIVSQSSQSVGGVGQGAILDEVTRKIDTYLQKQVRVEVSSAGYADTLSDFHDRIQTYLGQPGANNSLSAYVDDFYSSLRSLAANTELPSLRLNAVSQAESLSTYISGLAETLEQLRFDADKEFKNSITFINQQIDRIHTLNINIKEGVISGHPDLDLIEERDKIINKLAEKININVYEQTDGSINIVTSAGLTLLDASRYHLSYTSATSTAAFVNDVALTSVQIAAIDDTGATVGTPATVVTGGVGEDIENKITGGAFRAYSDMRDVEIPRILAQLDNLADNIRDAVNAIHNDGTGFPPVNSFTGTRAVTANDQFDFSGKVMIAALTNEGVAIDSPYTGETGFRPLTLDLESLDSGDGAGSPTVQDIIDEINYYYGPPQARVTLGNISDINLAMVTNNIISGGGVSFDLEFDNASATNASITINGVNITNSAAVAQAVTVPAAFPVTAFTIEAGERRRSGSDATFSFTDSGGASVPYTVEVDVTVNDGTTTYTDTIRFQVTSTGPNIRNSRSEATNALNGVGTIVASPGGARVAYAELVDADGNTISGSNTQGYLKITAQNSAYGIAIDELDSQELGATNGSTTATNRGFSHFFELNNLFVTNNDVVKNSAINMAVRSDILTNSNRLSMGALVQSPPPADPTEALYTYEVGNGSNQVINRLADLKTQLISFSTAGTMPGSSTTLLQYSADVLAFISTRATNALDEKTQANLFKNAFTERFQSGSGVNLDEELANTILFQNAYTASTRVISAVKELFDALMQIAG